MADTETHQVIWTGLNHSCKNIWSFFERLGEYCRNIEEEGMDMYTAFDLEVQEHCPNVSIADDLFYVVAQFGREVMDRVRSIKPIS
nr:transposase [Vibrio sp. SCSIO 43153]